jgi:hypothetical protein
LFVLSPLQFPAVSCFFSCFYSVAFHSCIVANVTALLPVCLLPFNPFYASPYFYTYRTFPITPRINIRELSLQGMVSINIFFDPAGLWYLKLFKLLQVTSKERSPRPPPTPAAATAVTSGTG